MSIDQNRGYRRPKTALNEVSKFAPTNIAQLPAQLPLFPLDCVLLPDGKKTLSIFEPRYLAMVRDQLGTQQRLIGIVQPVANDTSDHPVLRQVGGAGRMVAFVEQGDGTFQIILEGCCRFVLLGETTTNNGYRVADVNWSEFADDLLPVSEMDLNIDRETFDNLLKRYLEQHDLNTNWEAIAEISDRELVHTLAMLCPFTSEEKQGMLESRAFSDVARMLEKLLEMGMHEIAGRASGMKKH